MDAHPAVLFRDGPAGRRAVLVGGPEVADVIGGLIGGDVPTAQRRSRAAELLGLSEAMVDAALAYYAEFTDEIDAALTERARAAEEAEEAWRRRQALLDEMHAPAVAAAFSEAGFDVVAVAPDPSLRGTFDADLLDLATAAGRAFVTENVGDFSVLAAARAVAGEPHTGLIFTNPAGSTGRRSPIPAT